MRRLHDLFNEGGQSPWLDNLDRRALTSGELAQWIADGIRGVTSNPTIFAKSMSSSDAYDAELGDLLRHGADIASATRHECMLHFDVLKIVDSTRRPVIRGPAGAGAGRRY